MSPGDTLFLYTDGGYDGSDEEERRQIEAVMREQCLLPAKDICNALLEYALKKDDHFRQIGEEDGIYYQAALKNDMIMVVTSGQGWPEPICA